MMKFIPVETIEKETHRAFKDGEAIIENILRLNSKIVKIECTDNDYSGKDSFRARLGYLIKKMRIPAIVKCMNGNIYVIRKDIT